MCGCRIAHFSSRKLPQLFRLTPGQLTPTREGRGSAAHRKREGGASTDQDLTRSWIAMDTKVTTRTEGERSQAGFMTWSGGKLRQKIEWFNLHAHADMLFSWPLRSLQVVLMTFCVEPLAAHCTSMTSMRSSSLLMNGLR